MTFKSSDYCERIFKIKSLTINASAVIESETGEEKDNKKPSKATQNNLIRKSIENCGQIYNSKVVKYLRVFGCLKKGQSKRNYRKSRLIHS